MREHHDSRRHVHVKGAQADRKAGNVRYPIAERAADMTGCDAGGEQK